MTIYNINLGIGWASSGIEFPKLIVLVFFAAWIYRRSLSLQI